MLIQHHRADVLPPRLLSMIAGTYREMPGLSLHLTEAARLFGVSATECRTALDHLVRAGHLRRMHDGQYRALP